MKRAGCVAIVGATGAVGCELLSVLEQREFPLDDLVLLASPRSAGNTLRFRGEEVPVRALDEGSFRGVDLALFSAGASVSRQFAPRAVADGAVVVDNSSAFRMDPEVPLVVPECNAGDLAGHRGIVANPNCSTILMVLALAPLQRAVGLRCVVASTYQAASGAGQRAMEELDTTSRDVLDGREVQPQAMQHRLAFNVFPHIDVFQEDGFTREEDKMLYETRKICGLPELPVEATCVRVPVHRCHSLSLTVGTQRAVEPEEARDIFTRAPGLVVADDPSRATFPQPIDLVGRDAVAVGRVRRSRALVPGLALWVVGDQLRKGAALNAVQIAENL